MIATSPRVNIRFIPRMGCGPCALAALAAPSDEQLVLQVGQQAANAAGNVLGILANQGQVAAQPYFAPQPQAAATAGMSNTTKLGLVAILAAAGYLAFRKR